LFSQRCLFCILIHFTRIWLAFTKALAGLNKLRLYSLTRMPFLPPFFFHSKKKKTKQKKCMPSRILHCPWFSYQHYSLFLACLVGLLSPTETSTPPYTSNRARRRGAFKIISVAPFYSNLAGTKAATAAARRRRLRLLLWRPSIYFILKKKYYI
jgi:hypothetical protein